MPNDTLSERLALYETRSKAAIMAAFDPTAQVGPYEREETVAAIARNYRSDVADLIAVAHEYEKAFAHAEDLIRALSMNPKESGERGTGRTTRMLLRGLIALSEGRRVLVVGATVHHGKNLAARLHAMAQENGIPIDHNTAISGGGLLSERVGFHGVVLVDHSVIEAL